HAVAHVAVLGDHVAAQHALELGPQGGDRPLRAEVAGVGLDLHAVHAQVLEREPQEQELALGVHGRPERAWVVPGVAQLAAGVPGVVGTHARGTYDGAGLVPYRADGGRYRRRRRQRL